MNHMGNDSQGASIGTRATAQSPIPQGQTRGCRLKAFPRNSRRPPRAAPLRPYPYARVPSGAEQCIRAAPGRRHLDRGSGRHRPHALGMCRGGEVRNTFAHACSCSSLCIVTAWHGVQCALHAPQHIRSRPRLKSASWPLGVVRRIACVRPDVSWLRRARAF